jgi:hypothetical protein
MVVVLMLVYLSVRSFSARNVLLLTMVADKQPCATTVWNIFFHMFLDDGSHSVMIEHCRKLVALSDSLDNWNNSIYGRFIRMSTEYIGGNSPLLVTLYPHAPFISL